MQVCDRDVKIRPLRSSTVLNLSEAKAAAETGGSVGRQLLSGKRKKDVDEAKKILHNLVSLLLTQQRSKRRVVRCSPGGLRDAIFKNLQPISVGA